ncbi:hypothetical protein [Erythrobacter colymbi]|uniref:hypothetical protein n=1 Tax=Erythrobacter colymbi TaxID=1161202 RepID=UPI000A3B2C54|nr:hypothetical protein [Erythrobacter colymbi]
MYKAVFQNSKIALIFAAMTIFSAVSMVGSSEDSGLLTRVVGLVNASKSQNRDTVEVETVTTTAPAKPASVFGDYNAQPGSAPVPPSEAETATPLDPATGKPVSTAPRTTKVIVNNSGDGL